MRHTRLVTAVSGPHHLQWGDVATWVASVGTVAAVVVALVQVYRERSSRLVQEQHDRERAQQDRDERHHVHARLISAWTGPAEDAPENERTEDASQEVAMYVNYRTPIYIHNGSSEPIYEIVVGLVFVQGAGPSTLEDMLTFRDQRQKDVAKVLVKEKREPTPQESFAGVQPATTLSILPPGTWRTWIRGRGWGSILSGRLGVDIAFTDRAGASWIRRASGALEELQAAPFGHFRTNGLYGPYDLHPPEPVV